MRKATEEKNINIRIAQIEGDSVLFRDMSSNSQLKVLTFPVKLTRGSERIVALIVQDANSEQAIETSTMSYSLSS